ncbi:MAG: Spy/CpxP family protein refolding chaperone [bacterium]
MRQSVRHLILGAAMFIATPLLAQQPNGGPPDGSPGMRRGAGGATMLLAHTADLQLTDAQVVRLAAIARREGAQRKAMRTMVDSLRRTRPAAMRRDSAALGRMTPPPQLTAAMTKARDQRRADLRDAITVLTPDQQAQAWEMVSARGARARGGMTRRAMRPRMGGGRLGGGMMPGRALQGGGRMQDRPQDAAPPVRPLRARPPQQRPPVEAEPAP